MIEVVESATFGRWIRALRDRTVGNGAAELRIHHGPGYCVNFLREAETAVMPCGGGEDSRQRDIERARRLARDWRQR